MTSSPASLPSGSGIAVDSPVNATNPEQIRTRLGDPRGHASRSDPRPAAARNFTAPAERDVNAGFVSTASAQVAARPRVGWGPVGYSTRRAPQSYAIYESSSRTPSMPSSGALANRTRSARGAPFARRLPSGCIEIGGGFVPPHERAALARRSNNVIVGSPPCARFDRKRLALKYAYGHYPTIGYS